MAKSTGSKRKIDFLRLSEQQEREESTEWETISASHTYSRTCIQDILFRSYTA